jgi:hypothetical protein
MREPHDHSPPLVDLAFALGLAPYRCLACFSHVERLDFDLSLRHAFSAFASFCARVSGLGLGLGLGSAGGGGGALGGA